MGKSFEEVRDEVKDAQVEISFTKARQLHLKKLDEAYAALRAAVADPGWNNLEFKKFKEALRDLYARMDRLRELNSAEIEASQ